MSTPEKKGAPPPLEIIKTALRRAAAETWLDDDGVPFVTVTVGAHREHYPLDGPEFEAFLTISYLREFKKITGHDAAPPQGVLRATQNLLRAKAMESRERHRTFVRMAHQDGRIFVDLADSERRAVVVDEDGYRVVASSEVPVRFVRPPGTLGLPVPTEETDAHALLLLGKVLGLPRDTVALAVLAALTAANPSETYPVLVLRGERGSGKSTLARLFGSLLDPRHPPLAAPPKNEDDLMVTASQAHVLTFDNLSGVRDWLSDALCRLATGGGMTKRKLYSGRGVERFSRTVLTVLNGIDPMTDRDDLASRSIPITLPSVEERRMGEVEIQKAFDEARPRLLGALCCAWSCALRELSTTRLTTSPRMHDAIRWAVASDPVLPFERGEMEQALAAAVLRTTEEGVESDPVASAVAEFAQADAPWEGSMTELHEALTPLSPEVKRMSPRKLAADVIRAAPPLAHLGFVVRRLGEKDLKTRRAIYRIERKS